MLIRFEEMGWVKHFRNEVPKGKKPQPNALQLATANKHVMDSEWILTMDADEFLSVKCGRGHVGDLIEAIDDDADAVVITWRFFGSNGITAWNPGLAIENFTKAAPNKFKKGWGVKTMFRPYEDIKLGIHRPHIKKAKQDSANAKRLFDQKWINGSGVAMPDEFSLSGWRSTKPALSYKQAEMNHYGVKSYEAYLLRRVQGNVINKPDKYDASYFALFDCNEIEAPNALRHARGTKKKMAQILSDPTMSALQEKALAFHQERVKVLYDSGEYDSMLTELKEASEVPIDKLDQVLFIQHLPKECQAKVNQMQAAGVPDKVIAKMIAQTQTAKKGEARSALLAAAGETVPYKKAEPEEEMDEKKRQRLKEKTYTVDDNPFIGTKEAAELGVPAAKIQGMALDSSPPLDAIVNAATTTEAADAVESDPGTVPLPPPSLRRAHRNQRRPLLQRSGPRPLKPRLKPKLRRL